MEKWGLGPEDVHAANPRAIYARVTGYGQTGRYRDRPGFASASEAIGGLRYINGYPGAGAAAQRHLASATRSPRSPPSRASCSRSTPATRAARPARWSTRASPTPCFAMHRVDRRSSTRRRGFVREPTGPRLPRIAPSNVYRSSDGKWVVIAANHDTLWRRLAKLMGHDGAGRGRALRHAPRARRARGPPRRAHRRVRRPAHGGGARPRSSTRPAWCARRSTRPQDIYDDPYFRERELLVDHEDEVHGAMLVPGVVPKLTRTPGSDPHGRRAGRWAPTRTRCWRSWAVDARGGGRLAADP